MLDPRFNARYTVIDKGKNAISHLAIRGGYGLFSKAPSLLYLYPDKAYWDKTGLSYYDPVAQSGLFVVTTKIFEDPRNESLAPAVNRKLEAGFDMTVSDIDINVTLYSEKMENGFSFESYYENFIFNRYTQPSQNGLDLYFVPGSGVFYTDPVSGTEIQLPVTNDTVFVSFTYPQNGTMTTKKGVEFTLDLGTVQALRTSFIVDGAWMMVRRQAIVETNKAFLGKHRRKGVPSGGCLSCGLRKHRQAFQYKYQNHYPHQGASDGCNHHNPDNMVGP